MLEIGTSGLMSGEEKRVIIRLISAADTALLLDSTQFGRVPGVTVGEFLQILFAEWGLWLRMTLDGFESGDRWCFVETTPRWVAASMRASFYQIVSFLTSSNPRVTRVRRGGRPSRERSC